MIIQDDRTDIHSCSLLCARPLCVEQRKTRRLFAALKEARRLLYGAPWEAAKKAYAVLDDVIIYEGDHRD